MPELPEVETTRRGIAAHIIGQTVTAVIIRQKMLRWPIPDTLQQQLVGEQLQAIERRAKYLLLKFDSGYLLIHLGMSGSLQIRPVNDDFSKHDHVDWVFNNQHLLRLTDPRRFGAVLWLGSQPENHKLIKNLGPEPLSAEFNGELLYQRSRGRKINVKQFIMDQQIVTGIGNIYANEALFNSHIRPINQISKISLPRYDRLAEAAKQILTRAIDQGGTTLRDFVGGDGKPGYFKQQLRVYGRGGLPCVNCNKALKELKIGGRSTVYCTACQT